MNATLAAERKIVHRTRGQSHGPVTRLMSPGDLGRHLKPFVFLDIVSLPDASKVPFGLHPHSGIATVTILTDGDASFDDGEGHSGIIGYGGVEWMRAGRGVWHGQEMNKGTSPGVVGFQLWLALPADMELERAESQYLEAVDIPQAGPARVIVGHYEGQRSPVRAPSNINYLVVTLQPGETWRYDTPAGHTVGWLAASHGTLALGSGAVAAGEMVVLDDSDGAVELRSTDHVAARFVIASAAPHPHDLHLGHYSVHTSAEALAAGEAHIAELHGKLIERERQRPPTANGSVPILR